MDKKIGIKNDYIDGKLRWDLLPVDELEKIVEVFTKGANKYQPNSWQYIQDPLNRYYAALMRHLVAWRKGEKIDSDTGCEHLAQVAVNAIFLLHLSNNKYKENE